MYPKANRDIEDYVHQFVQIIQQAVCNCTSNPHKFLNVDECSPTIKQKISEKRKLRRRWQRTGSPQDKAKLNKAVNELKQFLND
jgi:chemotaxis regulatin CheY-phosphate phosphatase CheZ